jgi:hypothetical protein
MAPSRVLSPHTDIILSSLQFQGFTNNCGPTTTAIVLNALCGLTLNGPELAEQMNKMVWRGVLPVVRRIPNSATLPWGMVDVFRSHGMKATWRIFTRTSHLFEGLARGKILMPVIGSIKPVSAHVMTLVAWDQKDGWGFANTAYDEHKIFWESDPRFMQTWGSFSKSWRVTAHLLVEAKHG